MESPVLAISSHHEKEALGAYFIFHLSIDFISGAERHATVL